MGIAQEPTCSRDQGDFIEGEKTGADPVDSSEEEEELPQKRSKKTKVSKSVAQAVQKNAKKSSSHSAGKEHTKMSRKPVKRAVYDEVGPSDDE